MGKSFDQYYQDKLLPNLLILEEKRKKNKKFGVIAFVFVFLTYLIANIFLYYDLAILVGFISIIPALIFFFFKKSPIKEDFKNLIVAKIVKYIDESLIYNHYGFIPQPVFRSSLLFRNRIDRYKGDDHVKGKIGKTDIEFSELHAEYKTTTRTKNGGKQTQWHTLFKGFFIIADFHKDFEQKTLIVPNNMPSFMGFIGRKLKKWSAPIGKIVKLEDVEFSKYFVVYSEDQIEARYLISTSMMQRILNYRKKWDKTMHISLIDSKLYMAISTNKNFFEPTTFKSLLGIENYQEMLEYMNLIIEVVEELNLNTRIWTKQ